jgi:protein-L-isoaspartate(D-aspartate) O-methyltransferase
MLRSGTFRAWLARMRHPPVSDNALRQQSPGLRQGLVRQLLERGISDKRVLEAFRQVPREHFVPDELKRLAYADRPLPIGSGQAISQPYVIARTLEALTLDGTEVALEVGTGSGYVAALLSCLVRSVYTVERIESLAVAARERLARLGYRATVLIGDGSLGWPEAAPFDAIAVAATAPCIPSALTEQLAPRGRMVLPVRDGETEQLVCVKRTSTGDFTTASLAEVRFVPLIGAQGMSEPALS